MDKAGVIWSARSLLRWDPDVPDSSSAPFNPLKIIQGDSYGLCVDSKGYVWNTSYGNGVIRKFKPNGEFVAEYNQGYSHAQGCVVDKNDHVWVAHSLYSSSIKTVGHLKNDGTYVGSVDLGTGRCPTGVSVDGKRHDLCVDGFLASLYDSTFSFCIDHLTRKWQDMVCKLLFWYTFAHRPLCWSN